MRPAPASAGTRKRLRPLKEPSALRATGCAAAAQACTRMRRRPHEAHLKTRGPLAIIVSQTDASNRSDGLRPAATAALRDKLDSGLSRAKNFRHCERPGAPQLLQSAPGCGSARTENLWHCERPGTPQLLKPVPGRGSARTRHSRQAEAVPPAVVGKTHGSSRHCSTNAL